MSTPYIGEIRMFAGNFAPVNWAMCNGQLLPISQYDALYALIGTTYGGDGQQTFALPNLQSRIPLHQGTNPGNGQTYVIGQIAGEETVTLTVPTIPSHRHTVLAATNASSVSPSGAYFGGGQANLSMYFAPPPSVPMSTQMVGIGGGSQPHENMVPFLAVTFIIALFGIFPTQG